MNMKARVVTKEDNILILHYDGTMSISTSSLLKQFLFDFSNYSSLSGEDGKWTDITFDMSEFPGTTMAFVSDSGQLVVNTPDIFNIAFMDTSSGTFGFLTVEEYAKKHNRSKQLIRAYAMDGRIPGVTYFGHILAIPADAPYPIEAQRRKPTSGKTKG